MNSIRQFFTLRSLAAFRQTVSPNPLAADDEERPCYANLNYQQRQSTKYQPQGGFWNRRQQISLENNYALQNVGCRYSSLTSSSKSTSSSSFSSTGLSLPQELHTETLKLGYRCKICSKRSTKMISKQAYKQGVVIVSCPGCSTNHLIIDNTGWFKDVKGTKNIEDVIAANKGIHVTKIVIDEKGGIIQ